MQAGVQQRLRQESRERSFRALPRARHQRAQDAMRQAVIRSKDAGLHRAGRDLGLAIVTNEADPNLLGAKQERKDMDGAGPIRMGPGVIWYEHSMSTDRPDRLTAPLVRHLHPVTPMKGNGQPREVGHISKQRRSDAELREMYPANSSAAKELLQFAHNGFVSLSLRSN